MGCMAFTVKLPFEFVYIGIVYGLDLRDDSGRNTAKCLHQ